MLGMLITIGAAATGTLLIVGHFVRKPKNIRIGVSFITPTVDRVTGLSSYTESLVDAIARCVERPPLVFLTNARREVFNRLANNVDIDWITIPPCPRNCPFKLYRLFIHDWACWRAKMKGCGFYASTTAAGALFPVISQSITLHDLYDIDKRFRPWHTVLYTHALWRWAALVSRWIICVSASTAEEAKSFVPFATKKLRVIKEASKYTPQDRGYASKTASFIFVANIQPTKNVECLLEAIRRADGEFNVDWVGWDPEGIVEDWMAQHGSVVGFKACGSVSDAELCDAYCRAAALIVTSFSEGFCLPVLEAHALGVPVIASDIPTLREVAGAGALYFNLHDPDALLSAMRKLNGDAGLRERLKRAALANARLYSWDKAAAETLELLELA